MEIPSPKGSECHTEKWGSRHPDRQRGKKCSGRVEYSLSGADPYLRQTPPASNASEKSGNEDSNGRPPEPCVTGGERGMSDV